MIFAEPFLFAHHLHHTEQATKLFSHRVTYKDFNDKQHTEDIYFHMLAPEWADLEFNPDFGGSMSDYIRNAMRSGDGAKVYTFFKLMIVNSYGRRSEDGSKFSKKAEWTEDFLNSLAYEEFFMWLVENPKNAEKFWHGIVPQRMIDKAQEIEGRAKKDLKDLSKEELLELMRAKLEEKAPTNEVTAS